MPNKAARLAEAKRSVRAEAKRKVAARKAAAGNKGPAKAKAKAPVKTRGITNIIKKRKEQAARVFKQASR